MNPVSPAVSVIIPTYNSSRTLRWSLESVLRQDFSDLEVWVIGDGCTDDSGQVVDSFGDPRAHWINLSVNSGTPSKPRDEGLRRATGRLVAYLGHDDLWFPWHLSELVDCIDKTRADLVYSLCLCLGPGEMLPTSTYDSRYVGGVTFVITLPDKPWNRHLGITPSNWLHRRELYDRVGPWSRGVKIGDDRELLDRVHAVNAVLQLSGQVSVLKFPSGAWKTYAPTAILPQAGYAEALRRDPAQLRLDLLLDVATAWSRQPPPMLPDGMRLPAPLRALIEWSLDRYGRQRWPVNDFLYWRWRREAGLTGEKRK